jgi:TolB protein
VRKGAWIAASVLLLGGIAACGAGPGGERDPSGDGGSASPAAAGPAFETRAVRVDSLIDEKETRFGALRQLTFGGQNAEAYWSVDDEWIVFQATPRDGSCDQQYIMRPDGSGLRLVSTGEGRTTCGYFLPGTERIIYASTHLGGAACPEPPDMSRGYVWGLFPTYDLFTADRDGSDLERLTDRAGYDAEATVSRDGEWVVFTSKRDGDLDIYRMRPDGSELTRLTDRIGYDGGPFFSYDGSKIVYRASHPTGEEELADYRRLLEQDLIRPSQLDIWVMNADGTGKRQLTDNGAANFGPYFFPDGERIIFSSNMDAPNPRAPEFDLYSIRLDGTGLERITWAGDFDGFPMFNSDGSKLLFASNRGNELPRETNLFIADWVD